MSFNNRKTIRRNTRWVLCLTAFVFFSNVAFSDDRAIQEEIATKLLQQQIEKLRAIVKTAKDVRFLPDSSDLQDFKAIEEPKMRMCHDVWNKLINDQALRAPKPIFCVIRSEW